MPARRYSSRILFLAVLAPVLIAAVVYVVSQGLPASYESRASFRVTVPNQVGISDTVVTAANDLATQYAQLATTTPVINTAAKALALPASALSGHVSGSTVNAQNLVEVTATASTGPEAERRAMTVANALRGYINGINVQQSATYSNNVIRSLGPLNKEIAKYSKAHSADVGTLLGSLLAQRQQVLASLAQDAAAGQPTLQGIANASPASQTVPRPKIYALVALLVTGLISARIAVLRLRPSAPAQA